MRIEKLPSGSYRIRKTYKGKTYSIVTEYKPTQREAIQLMAEELSAAEERSRRMTFEHAAEDYIASKENVLSPSTVREYKGTLSRISEKFRRLYINDITQLDIQTEINRFARDLSPKTVRNYHAFISSVLSIFRPNMKLSTTLPQKIKNNPYIPSEEDIKKILRYVEGSPYEVAFLLACYGLRRSEICALTIDDLEDDILHINKALVMDEQKQWVIKTTKTTASTRDIIIPDYIIQKIQAQGYIYNGHPNSLTDYLFRIQKKLDIPRFSIHKFRHFFASKLSAMNVPEADIMLYGGWETDYVMKNVYRHSLEDKNKDAQRRASEKLKDALFS